MTTTPTTSATMTVPSRAQLDEFFKRVDAAPRGRVILAIDATASRQETWDTAAKLQADMFETVAAIGGLDVQLAYYRGAGECRVSRWMTDGKALASTMSTVTCRAGHTQIARALQHAGREHARQKIGALILISDACEENPADLYAEARELGFPVFLFQEGEDARVAKIYGEIAKITNGAHCTFDSNSAQRLRDLLTAVAAFATGGVQALANQNSEAAKLLLTQIKK
jgi:hypothetical protein